MVCILVVYILALLLIWLLFSGKYPLFLEVHIEGFVWMISSHGGMKGRERNGCACISTLELVWQKRGNPYFGSAKACRLFRFYPSIALLRNYWERESVKKIKNDWDEMNLIVFLSHYIAPCQLSFTFPTFSHQPPKVSCSHKPLCPFPPCYSLWLECPSKMPPSSF